MLTVLICCGANIITSVNEKSPERKCWTMMYDTLLKEPLPQRFKTGSTGKEPWSRELFLHVCTFLGNDFIVRNPGNAPGKVKAFVDGITKSDAPGLAIKTDAEVYDYIRHTALIPYQKKFYNEWPEEKKDQHTKRWIETREMFRHGPAFRIIPLDHASPRDAIASGNFEVSLDSMSGGNVSWTKQADLSEHDEKYGSSLLIGFSPKGILHDKLAMRKELESNVHDEAALATVYKKCFHLEVWTKTSKELSPVPSPTDSQHRPCLHGAIINFDKIPPEYLDLSILKFWLASRQIKVDPNRIMETVKLVLQMTPVKDPIPKEMMRGKCQYVSPEVIKLKIPSNAYTNNSHWKIGDDLIELLRNCDWTFTEQRFTEAFGKRNGTRLRALRHIEGGSYDLLHIKASCNFQNLFSPEMRILVIVGSCAPSYKLKQKNKESFYTTRLVAELDESGKYKRMLHHPLTSCSCPNGWILCAHLGGLIGLCHSLLVYNNEPKTNTTASGEGGNEVEANRQTAGRIAATADIRDEFAAEANEVAGRIAASADRGDEPEANTTTAGRGDEADAGRANEGNNSGILACFEDIRSHFPVPVNEVLTAPMTVQTAYPENCSQKKSAQREFVKKKKRRTSKNKKRSPRKKASTDEEKQEDDSDNEGDVLSEDELDDLREFSNEEGIVAFGNVLDASSVPTMKVISKIEEWICDVKEKRTYNGAERRSAESNREDLRNIVRHKQSKEYIATKIVVQDRMRKYLIGIYGKQILRVAEQELVKKPLSLSRS